MGRRSGTLRVAEGGELRRTPDDLLGALAEGAAEPQVVFEVLDGGEIVVAWVNQAAAASGLLAEADWANRAPDVVLRPECAMWLRDGYPESLRLGERYASEQFIDIEGRETWWLTTLAPLLGADGRPRWIVATYLQLDFVRRTEVALERTEANIRRMIDATPDAIVVCRADSTPVFANPAAAALFALDRDALSAAAPRSVLDLVPEPFRESLRAGIASALDGDARDPLPFELRLGRSPEDRVVILELRAIRLVFDDTPGVLISARDVTEVRLVQGSIAVADRLIALGRMAAGVAHEVNNPLAYVHANLHYAVEEIERVGALPAGDAAAMLKDVAAALKDALEGAERVREIIQDLKSLAQTELGDQRAVSIDGALDSALKLARAELKSRGRLVTRSGPAPAVLAHEPRLVQLFLNLLLNAAHALAGVPKDKAEITITVGTDQQGRAVVDISDNGAGIRASELPRLFDPFYTTRIPGEGLGLGLSVCHQIATSLGGRIEVESSVGAGSTFRVILPGAPSAEHQE